MRIAERFVRCVVRCVVGKRAFEQRVIDKLNQPIAPHRKPREEIDRLLAMHQRDLIRQPPLYGSQPCRMMPFHDAPLIQQILLFRGRFLGGKRLFCEIQRVFGAELDVFEHLQRSRF